MLSRYKDSYVSYVIFYMGYYALFSLFGSVMSVYLTGIGMADWEMSLILSAAGMFSFFVTPVTGYINDRAKSQRAVLAVLLLAIGGLALLYARCRGLAALFVLNGLTMALINSVTPVCERIAGESRYRYGLLRVWGTIGYAAGAQAAGLAVEKLPGWGLFALTAGACGVCLLGLYGVGVGSAARPQSGGQATGEKPRLSALLESPRFFLFLGAAFLFAGCSGVNINYAPVLLNRLGIPTGAVGTVLFLSTLTEIPLILFSHKFMDRFSGRALMGAAFCLAIGQYLAYGMAGEAWVVVAVMVLVKAVASTLYMMLSLKMVRCLVPPGLTTTGLGVVASVNNLAAIAMQNAGGWATGRWGMGAMYLGMAALCGAGLALTCFLKAEREETVFG